MNKWLIVILFVSLSVWRIEAQVTKNQWIDSVWMALSPQEKAAQLIMLSVDLPTSKREQERLKNLIRKHQPGLLRMNQMPASQDFLAEIQALAKIPILVATSTEGIKSISSAKFIQVGSVSHDTLITAYGSWLGQSLKRLGAHIFIGPNVNPIPISTTYPTLMDYLGNMPEQIKTKADALIQGLRRKNIIVCPDKNPFPAENMGNRQAAGGVPSFLVTRSDNANKIDEKKSNAAKMSVKQKNDAVKILSQKTTATTSLDGKDDKAQQTTPVLDDVMTTTTEDMPEILREMTDSAEKNNTLRTQLETSVKHILALKYDAGLWRKQLDSSVFDIDEKTVALQRTLIQNAIGEASVILLNNRTQSLPIKFLGNRTFYHLSLGGNVESFLNRMASFVPIKHAAMPNPSDSVHLTLGKEVTEKDMVIVSVTPEIMDVLPAYMPYVAGLEKKCPVVWVSFASWQEVALLSTQEAVVIAHGDEKNMQEIAAEMLFGSRAFSGISSLALYPAAEKPSLFSTRLAFDIPEAAGMHGSTLQAIAPMANEFIRRGDMPGCQIFVARRGKVVYQGAFGYQAFNEKAAVDNQTIYDLASVTKIAATLQAFMFLYERGIVDLQKTAASYLPELDSTDKKDITLEELLIHQGGLKPYILFWRQTVKDGRWDPAYYSKDSTEEYSVPIAPHMFARPSLRDFLWQKILQSKRLKKNAAGHYDYQYSDLDFYILQRIVEKYLKQPINSFIAENLYKPLGANTLGYLPLQRFTSERIAPTERDNAFRMAWLRGYVHDPGAAMMGGVAGHAGLFGTALDLAKLGQFWLQKGRYGEMAFFQPGTLDKFTMKVSADSRRALGFDKPLPNDWHSLASPYASTQTFGHTGFTGVCIWVDPYFDLVYVFLSNRISPNATNNGLMSDRVRQKIHDIVYKSIFEYERQGLTLPYENSSVWEN